MARKTTVRALEAIAQYEHSLRYYEEVLRVKRLPIENQADFIKNHSLDYFQGWMDGIHTATDNLLMRSNCYYGFYYVDKEGKSLIVDGNLSVESHPDYSPIRIKYYIK